MRAALPPPPPAVFRIAAQLRDLRGVVCVVWGARKTKNRWFKEPCISVHVKKKRLRHRLKDQLLPPTIDGYRLDVLEVGVPKPHGLGVRSRIDAGPLGVSTATAVAAKGADALALLSGHGALNAANGQIQLIASDDSFPGEVVDGAFGGGLSLDWALANFPGGAGAADATHPLVDASAPIPLANGLVPGEMLEQYSEERGLFVDGILQGTVLGQVSLGPDIYTSLLSIVSRVGGEPFSVPGDSGSLVVDADRRAVGAIVGGKSELHVFYAYDLARLRGALPLSRYRLFFEDT